MNVEKYDLLELLSGAQQFEVPLYQRPYSWTDDHRRQLWDDLLRAGTSARPSPHFVGSLVYTQPLTRMGGGTLKRARLIDGQQRLTTLTLLMLALVERLEQTGDLHLPDETVRAAKLRERYLLNEDLKGEARFKLLPTHADRGTFKHLLAGEPLPQRPSGAVLAALDFFRARLQDAGVTLPDVLRGLRKLEVVAVVLQEGHDDPQLIFESLNSTGKDLTQADLIRNNVLMGLHAGEQDELSRTYWLPMEALFGGGDPSAFDRFMRDFLTVRTRSLPNKDAVYAAFKAYRETLDAQPVQLLVADIRQMAQHYAFYLQPQGHSDAAARLALQDLASLNVGVISPFVLELLQDHGLGLLGTASLVSVLRLVEALLVRRAVSEYRSNPLNKLFAGAGRELIKDQGSAAYLRSAERALMRFTDRNQGGVPSDEVFAEKLRGVELYTLNVCKQVLVRLERSLSPKEQLATDTLTIEHILPQNENLSEDWREMLGENWKEVQARLVHTLGNLTLTGYNSELGDKPFEVKKTLPEPRGYEHSKILMTRKIAAEPRWDEATITAHAQQSSALALTLWPLPAFSEEELRALRAAPKPEPQSEQEAWQRLINLPGDLPHAVSDLAQRTLALAQVSQRNHPTRVGFYKGPRSFVELYPKGKDITCWAVLGESPAEIGAGWQQGKDAKWWKYTLQSQADVTQIWPTLQAAWANLPEGKVSSEDGGASALSAEDRLKLLPAEQQAVWQALENLLNELVPNFRRSVTRNYIGYSDRRNFVELYPRTDYLLIGVRLGNTLDAAEAEQDWKTTASFPDVWTQHMKTLADLERVRPAIEKAYLRQRKMS